VVQGTTWVKKKKNSQGGGLRKKQTGQPKLLGNGYRKRKAHRSQSKTPKKTEKQKGVSGVDSNVNIIAGAAESKMRGGKRGSMGKQKEAGKEETVTPGLEEYTRGRCEERRDRFFQR